MTHQTRSVQTKPRQERRHGFTLVEIMVVVLLIGILLAISVPYLVSARESSRARACVANLYQINSAKTQCAMDNKLAASSAAAFSVDGVTPTVAGPDGMYQLTQAGGSQNYIRSAPVCPSGGVYTLGGVTAAPTCSVATGPPGGADYQTGGKWFHGY